MLLVGKEEDDGKRGKKWFVVVRKTGSIKILFSNAKSAKEFEGRKDEEKGEKLTENLKWGEEENEFSSHGKKKSRKKETILSPIRLK